jgi:hypothetical protein
LVVVCVGSSDWQFRSSLEQHIIEHNTVHIDETRPDLTKFDALIGDIAYNCMGLTLEGDGGSDKDDVPTKHFPKEMDVYKCEEADAAEEDFVLIE